jgi:hypothetical protein
MLLKALLKLVVAIIVVVSIVVTVITGGGSGGTPGGSQTQYTVGGDVSGLTGTLVLQNNGGDNLNITSNGGFTFATRLKSGMAFAVTVLTQPANQRCTVSAGSGTVGGNVTSVAVSCVSTYAISATVSGLQGTGLVLGSGTDSVPVTGNTYITFPSRIANGAAYGVTVLAAPNAPRQSCVVANGSGVVSGADVTNVQVSCRSEISGVAAVGLPLVGQVTVKDSNGATRTVEIGTNGSYTVDVSDLVGPFVFRASGKANDITYTVYSAAVAADIGGNINITPLTDLIVGNIAHRIASNYFANPDFSLLTTETLNAETQQLRQRLLPVLSALGVEDSIDLLRSQFTPLASTLDAALDVMKVSVDAATNIATITNIVTQQKIYDSILVPASAEAGAPVMSADGSLDTVATDIAAVRARMAAFSALYATNLPSYETVLAQLAPDFLDSDSDRTAMAANLAGITRLIGGSFTEIEIKDLDYSGPLPVATLNFMARGAGGVRIGRLEGFRLRKTAAGSWQLLGNQRALDLELLPMAEWHRGNRNIKFTCVLTGMLFITNNDNPANDGGVINHLMAYGPGLPGGSLRISATTPEGDRFVVPGGGRTYVMGSRCPAPGGGFVESHATPDADIAAIPDKAEYTVVAYSSADDSVRINLPGGWSKGGALPNGVALNGAYVTGVSKRPATLVEATGSLPDVTGNPPAAPGLWPFITAPVTQPNWATGPAIALYNGGPLTITAAGMNPAAFSEVDLSVTVTGSNYRTESDDALANAAGLLTTSVNLALPGTPGPCDVRRLAVGNTDADGRSFTVITEASPLPLGQCTAPPAP